MTFEIISIEESRGESCGYNGRPCTTYTVRELNNNIRFTVRMEGNKHPRYMVKDKIEKVFEGIYEDWMLERVTLGNKF